MEKFDPFTEERPWGGFREFTENDKGTVKIIFVRKGEAFSLQKHENRHEFWRVLSGNPDITIGSKTTRAKKGDEFDIQPKIDHRISASIDDTEILEISRGQFAEDDIIRIKDKYGRV
jgi:mannose-6-phosphate isomerase